MTEVNVILTPAKAEYFKKFMEHHDMFMLLVNNGVFDVKYGKATLNFTHGQLQTVVKEEIVWHKS